MLIKCGNGTCTFFISTFNCRLYIDSVQASSAAGFAWFSRICNRYTSFRAALDSEELVCNRDVVRSLHEGYPKCLNVINHKNIILVESSYRCHEVPASRKLPLEVPLWVKEYLQSEDLGGPDIWPYPAFNNL